MSDIAKRAGEIRATQAVLAAELRILQAKCSHPRAVKKSKANTGNYDPSADHYWRDCSCPDCDKFWTEDQ